MPAIWVKSAALDLCQSLPVFLDKRTFSAAVTCLKRANRRHGITSINDGGRELRHPLLAYIPGLTNLSLNLGSGQSIDGW